MKWVKITDEEPPEGQLVLFRGCYDEDGSINHVVFRWNPKEWQKFRHSLQGALMVRTGDYWLKGFAMPELEE